MDEDEPKGAFWHDRRGEMESAIRANDRPAFEAALAAAMSTPNILKDSKRIVESNAWGKPYTAFGATDMAAALLQGAKKWGNDAGWIDMAIRCLRPVIGEYPKGLRRSYGKTAWLHAQTNPDRKMPGGTLNKHMLSALNLADCARWLEELGRDGSEYRALAIAAVEQLASTDGPNLDSFIYRTGGKRAIESWLYYAVKFNGEPPYWLDNDPKNGTYHLLVMRLFARLHDRLGGAVRWKRFTNRGTLKNLLKTYEAKMADGGLYVDSKPAKGGRFGRVLDKDGKTEELTPDVISFFRSLG